MTEKIQNIAKDLEKTISTTFKDLSKEEKLDIIQSFLYKAFLLGINLSMNNDYKRIDEKYPLKFLEDTKKL